jgi:hypothetical protein
MLAWSLSLVASAHFVERAPSLCGSTPLAALGGKAGSAAWICG